MYQLKKAKELEVDRQETYVAILGSQSYGKRGETIRHLKDRIFGHQTEQVNLKMDDEEIKSFVDDQPDWLREKVAAGRKANREAWAKHGISTETTNP